MNYQEESGLFVSELLNGTNGAVFAFAGRNLGSFNPKAEGDASGKVVDVLGRLGLGQNFFHPIHGLLVHGDELLVCTERTLQIEISSIDALVTQTLRLPLFLYVADCPAVAIFDPVRKVAALVHSGRRGTELNICQKTISHLQMQFGSKPNNLLVAISPYIGACGGDCYELSLASAEPISGYYPKAIVGYKDGKVYLDIGEAIVSQLIQAGILVEHIEKSNLCTKCANGTFYSYRARTLEERSIKPNNGAILCMLDSQSGKAVTGEFISQQRPLLIFLLLF